MISSISSTSGNGGLLVISGAKFPAGGYGAQDGILSEYLAYVGDESVRITKVDVANNEVTIKVKTGLYGDGEVKDICVTIDLISINCGANAL